MISAFCLHFSADTCPTLYHLQSNISAGCLWIIESLWGRMVIMKIYSHQSAGDAKVLEKKVAGCEWIVWRIDTRFLKNLTKIFNLYYCRWIFICLRKRLLDVNGLYEGQTQDIKKTTKIFNLYYCGWIFICKHSSHSDIKTHEHNVHFLWINIYSANEMYTKSTQGSFTLSNDTTIRQFTKFRDCSNWSLLTAIVFQTVTIHPWWKKENQTCPPCLIYYGK